MTTHPVLSIRPATVDDVPLIRALIAELAEYEKLADAAVATDADPSADLNCPLPRLPLNEPAVVADFILDYLKTR